MNICSCDKGCDGFVPRYFRSFLQAQIDTARDMIGATQKKGAAPARKEGVLQNSRLYKRREDALKRNVPYITHNNHSTHAHQKCHQEIDGIIIQQTKPALDMSACRIIAFLVMRAGADRHLIYIHTKSA